MTEHLSIFLPILVPIVLFVLSVFPLQKAVKIVKGKTNFVKTFLIVFVSGIAISFVNSLIQNWAGIIVFAFLLWFYKKAFKLNKWYKAFFVWFLHLAFIVISFIITEILFNALLKISVFFG
jgi:hypothetical protein